MGKIKPTPLAKGTKKYILPFATPPSRIHVGVFQQSGKRKRLRMEEETYALTTVKLEEFHTDGSSPSEIPMMIVDQEKTYQLNAEMVFFSTPRDQEFRPLCSDST